MTKRAFMVEIERELRSRYTWTADEAKLDRFLSSVRATVDGGLTWNKDGEAAAAAWKAIGGKGKLTYKALHALPA